jgi:hypothetical protein
VAWYRNDKAAVAEALRRGERPDLATTMASGPLDELVALHQDLGIFAILDELEVQRERAGVPDDLLLRTLATLPFVDQASLSGASEVLFREPAVLLQLGWAPMQMRAGSNGRHGHPAGRQEESLPCHVDTLRDALRRVGESAWLQAQQAGVQALYHMRKALMRWSACPKIACSTRICRAWPRDSSSTGATTAMCAPLLATRRCVRSRSRRGES